MFLSLRRGRSGNRKSNAKPILQATVLVEVSTTSDEKKGNLNGALFLGSNRVIGMEKLGLLSEMTVSTKESVDAGYFTDKIIKGQSQDCPF